MAQRPYIKAYPLITAASMAVSIIGPVTNKAQLPSIGYTLSWSGTPTGSFTIEVCNDAQFEVDGSYIAGTGTWVALVLSNTITASGTADTAYIDIQIQTAAFMRLHYTRSSGSGTLNVSISGLVQ